MNIQNGVSSVPVYQRWYSSPKMVQAARGRAMVLNEEPEPEPKPWHVIWDFSSSGSYYKGGPSDSGDHMETVDFSLRPRSRANNGESCPRIPGTAGSDVQHDPYRG